MVICLIRRWGSPYSHPPGRHIHRSVHSSLCPWNLTCELQSRILIESIGWRPLQQEPHPRSNMMYDMPCMIGRQCMEEKVCDCMRHILLMFGVTLSSQHALKGHDGMHRFFVVCTTYTFHSSLASHLCSHSGSTTGTTGNVQSLIRRSSPCVAETSELFLCLLISASFHTALSRSLTLYHSVHSVRLLFTLTKHLLQG